MKNLNMKYLIAFLLADIDIFLLQSKAQSGDNEKEFFTREEIREQLKKSGKKMCEVLSRSGIDIEKTIN